MRSYACGAVATAVAAAPFADELAVGEAGAGAVVEGGVEGAVLKAEPVTGMIFTPVTFPVTVAFCFLLVVPRALRVASAFAVAAARAAADSGLGIFLGWMASSVRTVGALLNINATTSLTPLTVFPSAASAATMAALASFQALFDVAAVTVAFWSWPMSVTTCGVV